MLLPTPKHPSVFESGDLRLLDRIADSRLPRLTGSGRLFKSAFDQNDPIPSIIERLDRVKANPGDISALMDLSLILQFCGRRELALRLQADALNQAQVYFDGSERPGNFRLLAFVAKGDLMVNTPLELILDESDVTLIKLYVLPDVPLTPSIPDHDIAIVAIGESDQTAPLLQRIANITRHWPRPVLNDPTRVPGLSRDRLHVLLDGADGVAIPKTLRIGREELLGIADEPMRFAQIDADLAFPITLRPVGSHGGHGLAKIDDGDALRHHVKDALGEQFFLSTYIDCAGPDHQFRKYRVAMIGGRPHLCHLAISPHWVVHYKSAGMDQDPLKRAEERQAMETFDFDFAIRHQRAFRAITERVGLDYFVIDCSETQDGALLIFEADIASGIHALETSEPFLYKQEQMRRVFGAFRRLLRKRVSCGSADPKCRG